MKSVNSMPETHKDGSAFAAQLAVAVEFFNDQTLPELSASLSEENPYADKDGLVEFIIGIEQAEDPVVMKNLVKQKQYLIALTSIVTDYVNRYAGAYGANYKTDVELWSLALSKLPLMGPSKIDKQTYTRHIEGVTIAKEFIDFILELVVSEGSSALNSCKKFMEKQGDAIRFGVEENKDYYKTIAIGVAVEVFMVGQEVVYAPKIKQYRVNFNRENSKFSSACASYEMVDIKFDYEYGANVFDYEALEDEAIKKEFDSFIQKQRKAQIDKSSTFFNEDFPVIKPD